MYEKGADVQEREREKSRKTTIGPRVQSEMTKTKTKKKEASRCVNREEKVEAKVR